MAEIGTNRLVLQPWDGRLSAELVALYADRRVVRYISRGVPLTPGEAFEISTRSARMWDRLGFGPWAVLERTSGRFVGRAGLSELPDWPGSDKIEVGWELHPWAWRGGYATEVGREAVRVGFEDLALRALISVTVPTNVGSRGAMRACGLTFRGVREFRGTKVVWYGIERRDRTARSRSPVR